MMTLTIQVPDTLVSKDTHELETLAREALVVRLFALGELSSGCGAEILSISRREFLDLASSYGVSIFDDTMDVAKEASYGD